MFHRSHAPLDLDILVLPETTLMLFAAIVEPLRAANRVMGQELYRWHVQSMEGRPVETASGVPVPVEGRFQTAGGRPLFVTASYNVQAHAGPEVIRSLGQAARGRPVIAGAEAAGWPMAEAGLLNGHRATTHWEDLDAFAARYGEVEVVAERFVRDNGRITTAGAAPTLDLMLELIGARQGVARASDVARLLNYRPGSEPLGARSGVTDPAVARVVALMDAHLDDPMPVAQMAQAVGLSPRHLQTRFRAALGMAPQAHYLGLRLGAARRLLIETRMPVLEVAAATGFASPAGFARAYRRQYRESPRETRKTAQARHTVSATPA
ncbi:MAG: GlxA family transcriptional regulator [Pseudomonadota bacterium]